MKLQISFAVVFVAYASVKYLLEGSKLQFLVKFDEVIMENQHYHSSFNHYYIHMADVFTRFYLTMGQLNSALLTDYIPHIHLERQLTYLGLQFSSRFLFHHLLAGPCVYQCVFCAIAPQFPSRIHRERNCPYCRGHRRLHRYTYQRNRVQIQPRFYNMFPLHIVPVHGTQLVIHLSVTHTCKLHNLVLQFIPSNSQQHELQTELLLLLQLNRLSSYTLHSRFLRHLANL